MRRIERYIHNLMQREDPDITERSVGFLYARLLADPAGYGIEPGMPKGMAGCDQVPSYGEFAQVCIDKFGAHEENGMLFVCVRG